MTADPESLSPSGEDLTVYTVSYLNGTSEEVVGIDNVRAHMLNAELRSPETRIGHELDDFQGGHWFPKREPVLE